MTALAATIGTGNLVGVATAMVLGGPGALVWMWISALFGLSTKFAESVLAVRYREKQPNGEMAGGPMYAMKNGFQRKKLGKALAFLFSLFAAAAAFGIGNMTQANSIAEALYASTGAEAYLVGLCLMVLSGCVLLGGIRQHRPGMRRGGAGDGGGILCGGLGGHRQPRGVPASRPCGDHPHGIFRTVGGGRRGRNHRSAHGAGCSNGA